MPKDEYVIISRYDGKEEQLFDLRRVSDYPEIRQTGIRLSGYQKSKNQFIRVSATLYTGYTESRLAITR